MFGQFAYTGSLVSPSLHLAQFSLSLSLELQRQIFGQTNQRLAGWLSLMT